MSTTLANFINKFEAELIEKGQEAFNKGRIQSLVQKEYVWHAEIADTKLRKVSVRIDNDRITDVFCTCQPGTCHHIIAVFFALQRQLNITGDPVDPALQPRKKIVVVNHEERAKKTTVREQAASFLDLIREGVTKKMQENPDCFTHRYTIETWDAETNTIIKGNMEGWLPAILPEYAMWYIPDRPPIGSAELHYQNFCWTINRSESPLPCFYPQYEGIPIQQHLWDAMVNPCAQFLIRQPEQSHWVKFKRVAGWWEQMAEGIRKGRFDDYLIFTDDLADHEPDHPTAEEWLDYKHSNMRNKIEWTGG